MKDHTDLLKHAALILAGESSRWTIQNMDCYPRIRLLFEILTTLGQPVDRIKREIIAECPHFGREIIRRYLEQPC